ncbi:MAG TPA: response regulator transcription factor [Acidimicrobiales bacterium]|nr:response regulator transcription factor [Acidimicrobiales bacterium]
MTGRRVLIVDDDPDLLLVLSGVYSRAGFEVETAVDGRSALRQLFERPIDLVVLDLTLPDLDGLEVLTRIRDMAELPVLLLTARTGERDKVTGLMSGADDYLTKPFSNQELIARSLALLRRSAPRDASAEVLDDGTVRIDLARREVRLAGELVEVTPTEWRLLVAFVQRPGLVLSPQQLLEVAWSDPLGIGPERVKFAVLRLRRRLGWDDPASSPIKAVRGFGYRYQPRSAADRPSGTDR